MHFMFPKSLLPDGLWAPPRRRTRHAADREHQAAELSLGPPFTPGGRITGQVCLWYMRSCVSDTTIFLVFAGAPRKENRMPEIAHTRKRAVPLRKARDSVAI